MNFKIHITHMAEQDLLNASDYIEFTLMNPDAADALLDSFEQHIHHLVIYPKKFPFVQDPILSSWGIRYTFVKNYIVPYIIDEEASIIYIIRFLYKKSNWISILQAGFSLL